GLENRRRGEQASARVGSVQVVVPVSCGENIESGAKVRVTGSSVAADAGVIATVEAAGIAEVQNGAHAALVDDRVPRIRRARDFLKVIVRDDLAHRLRLRRGLAAHEDG